MLKPTPLPPDERLTLENGYRNNPLPHFREKCQILLLFFDGKSATEIAIFFNMRKQTVHKRIHAYNRSGFLSFYVAKGRGLKGTMDNLSKEQVQNILKKVEDNPQSLRTIAANLTVEFGLDITKSKLKAFLKSKVQYTYHRLRKTLKPKQDEEKRAKLEAELEVLKELASKKAIEVYYGDQSGFSLDPCIPYGWQPRGKYNCIVPQRSKRRNVFGLLSHDNEFHSYDVVGKMDSDFVISCLDDFCKKKLIKRTVICLDNASIHRSKKFKAKIKEWQEQDLWIWFLPTYSPHLNLIETLWRKVKYEWLKPKDYLNLEALNGALDKIFGSIGGEYKIKFT
jgi:transposase